MIISDVTGKPTDTDRLSDINAELAEMSEKLRILCVNANRECLIMIDLHGHGKSTAFWNMTNNRLEFKNTDLNKKEAASVCFFISLDAIVQWMSKKTAKIVNVNE